MGRALSDEHLMALGLMTVFYSNLDMVLKLCVQKLLRTDFETGHALTAEMPLEQVLRILPPLYEISMRPPPEELKSLKTAINKARKVQRKRNSVVHSTWVFTGNPDIAYLLKMRAKEPRAAAYRAEDLRRIARELQDAQIAFTPFLTRILEAGKS